jgi:hypothetical protein
MNHHAQLRGDPVVLIDDNGKADRCSWLEKAVLFRASQGAHGFASLWKAIEVGKELGDAARPRDGGRQRVSGGCRASNDGSQRPHSE